jgi:endonuclease YncB( thermonuclease family)
VASILAAGLVAAWFQWIPPENISHATTAAAPASTIAGRASVIDGDTIEIHGKRIRILDIDAPESAQTCMAQNGSEWRCGQKAAAALSDWIAQQTVTCARTDKDKYGRWLARCAVGGADLAEWMASQGWAVPYRDCKCEVVRHAASKAKASQLGIWAGSFMLPWDWRAQNNTQTGTTGLQVAPQQFGCVRDQGEHQLHGRAHLPRAWWALV